MQLNTLNAISPIDGRYRSQVSALSAYFSEQALIQYRVKVEVEYFIALSEIPLPALKDVTADDVKIIREMAANFSYEDALQIKNFEKITNHDVKAVEYFLKEKFDGAGFQGWREFIHFGLTSQDINNTAIPLSFKNACQEVYMPLLESLNETIADLAVTWKDIAMLAYTHGQPASPTRLGKEFAVFNERLTEQMHLFKQIPDAAKFGGATGNLNAHFIAYPGIDWISFSNKFVSEKLGLRRSKITTQIEHYDHLAAQLDTLKRINTIMIDFSRDIWMYIASGYFKQKIKEGEIGSSAMPHKVNPIDFENAEGNLGMANALFEHLSAKLPVSRLQRDLTDSTVLRNLGVPMAHGLIAMKSLVKGLGKLILNKPALDKDLDENWAVVAEAIQTVLRREAYPNPYEALKELTRTNSVVTEVSIREFIESLDVNEAVKQELRVITPFNYTGI